MPMPTLCLQEVFDLKTLNSFTTICFAAPRAHTRTATEVLFFPAIAWRD
jgi:hypothetical protein